MNHRNIKSGISGMTTVFTCLDCGASWTEKTIRVPECKGIKQPEGTGRKAYGYSQGGLIPLKETRDKSHLYLVSFDGREAGAIGVKWHIRLRIYGPKGLTLEELRLACYSHFSNIHYFEIKER